MKKIILVVLVGLMFSGCYNDAQSSEILGNGFQVEYLFEKDGVKMYRFIDGGRTYYFTSKGETISVQSNGKSTWGENIK